MKTVEQEVLLLVTLDVRIEKPANATATVSFIDCNTGHPLVTCQKIYKGVLGVEMERIFQRAGQQTARTFK